VVREGFITNGIKFVALTDEAEKYLKAIEKRLVVPAPRTQIVEQAFKTFLEKLEKS
jgi:hypothetical protein